MPWKMGRAVMKETGIKPTISGLTQTSALRARSRRSQGRQDLPCLCRVPVQAAANVCRFCGHQFAKVEAAPELAGLRQARVGRPWYQGRLMFCDARSNVAQCGVFERTRRSRRGEEIGLTASGSRTWRPPTRPGLPNTLPRSSPPGTNDAAGPPSTPLSSTMSEGRVSTPHGSVGKGHARGIRLPCGFGPPAERSRALCTAEGLERRRVTASSISRPKPRARARELALALVAAAARLAH